MKQKFIEILKRITKEYLANPQDWTKKRLLQVLREEVEML